MNDKVIDLELGKELIGGDETMALELLQMLADNIPTHQQIILQGLADNNLSVIGTEAHKLHGAACYTGTPRIKLAAKALERSVKQNQLDSLAELVAQLDQEIILFLKEFNAL